MMNLQFDLPKEQASIIKVIGVGGGGSNAVNFMYKEGIRGVNYVVCNTDAQALDYSPVPNKIQLGPEITQGLGAGSRPEIGAEATEESEEVIKDILNKNTKMVFITAGMGGGTGTGGAPVIARMAKEMGILTVAIVTTPFSFEGRRKLKQAEAGIAKLKDNVDSIIIVSNDKIRDIFGNLSRSEAFSRADNILSTAARSISEIITVPGEINVDFADVEYVMKNSGIAIMGAAEAEGEDRARRAVYNAINSPLINDSNITGAQNILINITSGAKQVTIDEISEINDFVQDAAGDDTDIIFGTCDDDNMNDKLSVTIIATGFNKPNPQPEVKNEREIIKLEQKLNNDLKDDNAPISLNTPSTNETNEIDNREHTWDLFGSMEPEEKTSDDAFNFELKEKNEQPPVSEQKDEFSFYTRQPEKQTKTEVEPEEDHVLEDRKKRLRDISYKWDNIANMREMENIPAYERRNIKLKNEHKSEDEELSKYTLDNFKIDGENRPEIRKRNSFLDDNVD